MGGGAPSQDGDAQSARVQDRWEGWVGHSQSVSRAVRSAGGEIIGNEGDKRTNGWVRHCGRRGRQQPPMPRLRQAVCESFVAAGVPCLLRLQIISPPAPRRATQRPAGEEVVEGGGGRVFAGRGARPLPCATCHACSAEQSVCPGPAVKACRVQLSLGRRPWACQSSRVLFTT